ncbi:MAG TPA: hypothetical protein VHZ33_17725 [Trebonia sp.]|jgi:hypothetical protein|nr:hypothetical protein [Trebonia sp.]
MTSAESRADRFARELADLKIADPAAGHPRLWQRAGAALMAAGIVLGVAAYLISQRTADSLTASTAITIALGGVTLALVGGAIFLRYSLTGFLRFWMARQSFELNLLAERAFSGTLLATSDGRLDSADANRRTRTDSAPRP